MAFPDDLLEQAYHLARRERSRPKQASLRRAVSTAYYAPFHFLIEETVKNWKRIAERPTLARMFEHQNMLAVCRGRRDDFKKAAALTSMETHLFAIVQAFVTMQQQRHLADYDSGRKWTRTETVVAIKSVESAFASWKAIRHESTAQDFLVTLLIKERKRQ